VNGSLEALAEMTSVPGYSVPEPATGKTISEIETRRCHIKSSNLLGTVHDQTVGSTPKAWQASVDALARIVW
jgi:hypothetical protein